MFDMPVLLPSLPIDLEFAVVAGAIELRAHHGHRAAVDFQQEVRRRTVRKDQSEQTVGHNRRDSDFVIKPRHDQPQRFARDARGIRRFGDNIVLTDKLDIGTSAARKFELHHRKLNEEKQKAFIASYEKLLNSLGDDEAVLFADAVHPTHAARPAGCWAPSQEKLAIEQTSGRQRINIHSAIDLETGQTRMIEALTIDAASTIRLLQSIEALYPMLALIHVFLDNARYHHAKLVQEWLALPGRRIKLHFIPTYCPHLNPIERLWGLMHRHVTHNKCYATCAQFADATLSFLREKVPGNWANLCDSVTDNFRIINPKDFRVVT